MKRVSVFLLFVLLFRFLGLPSVRADDDFSMNDERTMEQIALDENQARPNFGIQVSGTYKALGTIQSAYNLGPNGMMESQAYVLEVEYQPTLLQTFGVLGIGPSFADYPTTGTLATGLPVTRNFFDMWAYGAQIRYQARYLRNQVVVPFAALTMQRLSYSFANGPTSSLTLHGGSIGVSLLLNALDQQQALVLFKNTGVSRSYFFLEGTSLNGSDANVSISGVSFLMGLRCEL